MENEAGFSRKKEIQGFWEISSKQNLNLVLTCLMSFIWFSQSIHYSYSDKQGVFFRVVFCYFNFIDCCNYYLLLLSFLMITNLKFMWSIKYYSKVIDNNCYSINLVLFNVNPLPKICQETYIVYIVFIIFLLSVKEQIQQVLLVTV